MTTPSGQRVAAGSPSRDGGRLVVGFTGDNQPPGQAVEVIAWDDAAALKGDLVVNVKVSRYHPDEGPPRDLVATVVFMVRGEEGSTRYIHIGKDTGEYSLKPYAIPAAR